MTDNRPIIIGMNNPLSMEPGFELYPAPEGCSGHRLWKMLNARTGASRMAYINKFERRNLCVGDWNARDAKMRAGEIINELWGSGRTVVLLGQEVRAAFGIPPLLVHPQNIGGTWWRQVPHPSGRNLWYAEPKNVRVIELLMEELYRGEGL